MNAVSHLEVGNHLRQRSPWLAGGLAVQAVSMGSGIRVKLKLMLRKRETRTVASWLVGGRRLPFRDEEPFCLSSLQPIAKTGAVRGSDRLRELIGDVPLHGYSTEFTLPKAALKDCMSIWIAFVRDDNDRSHDTIRLEIAKHDLKPSSDGMFRLLLTYHDRNERLEQLADHYGLCRPEEEATLTGLLLAIHSGKDTALLTEELDDDEDENEIETFDAA